MKCPAAWQRVPRLPLRRLTLRATRQDPSTFFFSEIAHYLYVGDTALHMAAAAFRRPVAELLVAHGADCRAKNRRGAEPLHYAADANHWDPAAQAETIAYLVSIGADPNALDKSGVAPLHRAVRTRSLSAVRRCWTAARTRGSRIRPGQRPCTSPFRPPGEGGAVPNTHANSRQGSSDCCWSAAQARPTKTGKASRCVRWRQMSRFGPCLSKHPDNQAYG